MSFRQKDGTWSPAVRLFDKADTREYESCPTVSPDRRWLFFGRDHDLYWVSAEVIASPASRRRQVEAFLLGQVVLDQDTKGRDTPFITGNDGAGHPEVWVHAQPRAEESWRRHPYDGEGTGIDGVGFKPFFDMYARYASARSRSSR